MYIYIYISNIMIIDMTNIEKKNACITLNKQTYVMEPRNQSKKRHGKSFLMCNFLITEEKNGAHRRATLH
jgi:hypothetical protein